MKKFIRIFLTGIASLFFIVCAGVCVILWFIFTPEKITPVIRNQAEKFLTCQTKIDRAELTFFSTFPHFAIKANGIALVNPMEGAPADTLFKAAELTGNVDVSAWWHNNELVVTLVSLEGGSINVFTDSAGNSNYDIVVLDDDSTEDVGSEPMFTVIEIGNVELKDLNVSYIDHSMKLATGIRDLNGSVSGSMNDRFVSGYVHVERSNVSFEFEGEKYLDNASLQASVPAEFIFSPQLVKFSKATVSVGGLAVTMEGSIQYDSVGGDILADISYYQDGWQIQEALSLIPSAFRSYVEGIDAGGVISSSGIIKGVYGDSVMPLIDIHLSLEDGAFAYEEIPLHLRDVKGDIRFCSDFKNDSLSFLRIENFTARTPSSVVETSGTVTRLLTDMQFDLTTSADLFLSEFNEAIPADLSTTLKGRASGKIKSVFSMSQMENLQLDRMKIAGAVTLRDLFVQYDSISIQTGFSEVDFSLPNPHMPFGDAKFAFFKIVSDYLVANQEKGFKASLQNPDMTLEISDVSDTTRFPNLAFSFQLDSLSASMDTLRVAMENPAGKLKVSGGNNNEKPEITLAYQSKKVETGMGQNTLSIHKLNIDTDVLNDETQKDFLLQWMAKGFMDMEKGVIVSSSLAYPLEIPAIEMDFTPEELNIRESRMRVGDSDFRLSGRLYNVLSYFRGDSLLRGDFRFESDKTDIAQLMNLTNGLNYEEEVVVAAANGDEPSASGPYMVPKGVDIRVSADISNASYGEAIINNIKGDLVVKDGTLVLEDITCENDAAKMQLTAMYRTPRKNHLFLRLDYHLLEVEIEELLQMIPEIDSLMPMLNSFRGKGEFHIAVETNLDSLYNIKKSTLRGVSSINGQDLVLMDGETFSEIAKKLNFSKKTQNKVDSLSAEFTIFREEIDVYPFLMVMDKYKAVIVGRHNFDLSFNYHISVVDCPLPIKLGVDVIGTIDDFDYNLTKCKFAEFYRPVSRKVVENKRLEFKKMIREDLVKGVAE